MRAQTYRRRSSLSFWLGLLFVLLFTIGGGVGLLLLLGVNLNPFATTEDPFVVRIPINSTPIPAYQRVNREHLLDPATRQLMYQRLPPSVAVGMSITGVSTDGSHVESHVESVLNEDDEVVFVVKDGRKVPQGKTLELGGVIMSPSAIMGRVVKKDKRVGLGFKEASFFPRGTPEGIAGATPPGMRAVTLDATKLTGVHALNAGDHVDLMASVPVGQLGEFESKNESRLPAAAMVASDSNPSSSSATEPFLLAKDAVVLRPVYVRNESQTSTSLTQGTMVKNIPKYEVAIAVTPEDVLPLQSALNKALNITCIAHSMQLETNEASDSPPPAADQRSVPVTVRPILAYDVVSRDAFVSPATRRMRMELISQQEIDRLGIITSVNEALGAIARQDIPTGRFLRKSDLLSGSVKRRNEAANSTDSTNSIHQDRNDLDAFSVGMLADDGHQHSSAQIPGASRATAVGDRPAITSFIPRGYTAFAFPWNRLYGAEHLQIGDQLDLLASFSLENDSEEEEVETRPDGTKVVRKRHEVTTRETMRTWNESLGMRGEPWFVASNAFVVGPVGFPAPAAALRALRNPAALGSSRGNSANTFSGPPLVIAVADRDVESLAAALAAEKVVFTVAFHSSEGATESDGAVQIALTAQDIAAYEQLSDTVWKGNRRRPLSRWVSRDDARFKDALTIQQMRDMEFRVLRRAKRRGEYFTADDFLPEGTRPGLAAAAQAGETIFAVADNEIEGLDAFQAEDLVTILVRGVLEADQSVNTYGFSLRRAVSTVVVPSARIVRASQAGRTVLAVRNEDLTRLQAAWASSISEDNGGDGARSHLLAVALPRGDAGTLEIDHQVASKEDRERQVASRHQVSKRAISQPTAPANIPSFDPLGGVKVMEAIVGRNREWHAFPADNQQDANANQSFNFVRQ